MSSLNFVSIPITPELFAQINQRYPNKVPTVVNDVLADFLERTSEFVGNKKKSGVYWDKLFLPDGTQLRTKYKGEYKYATIKARAIVYDNKYVPSISKLARKMRNNTSVNAWMYIEVKRPTDLEWMKADILRNQ